MTSAELFNWMTENNVSRDEMAKSLNVDPDTLSAYKSRGLPAKKQILAEKIVRDWGTPENVINLNEIRLQPSASQRKTWEEAGFIKGQEATDHLYRTLDDISDSIQIRKSSITKIMVAEDPTPYNKTKK